MAGFGGKRGHEKKEIKLVLSRKIDQEALLQVQLDTTDKET